MAYQGRVRLKGEVWLIIGKKKSARLVRGEVWIKGHCG